MGEGGIVSTYEKRTVDNVPFALVDNGDNERVFSLIYLIPSPSLRPSRDPFGILDAAVESSARTRIGVWIGERCARTVLVPETDERVPYTQ